MLKQFKAIVGVSAAVGLASFIAPAGDAPPQTGTMVVDPAGPLEPGDSFRISNASGSECLGGKVTGDTGGMIAGGAGAWSATPDETGDWEVNLQVPTEGPPDAMGNPTPFPPGEYEMHAFCDQEPEVDSAGFGAPTQEPPEGFPYDEVIVTVVAPAQEPEPEPEPEPTPPPAAAPVVETPTFTG